MKIFTCHKSKLSIFMYARKELSISWRVWFLDRYKKRRNVHLTCCIWEIKQYMSQYRNFIDVNTLETIKFCQFLTSIRYIFRTCHFMEISPVLRFESKNIVFLFSYYYLLWGAQFMYIILEKQASKAISNIDLYGITCSAMFIMYKV